VTKDFIYLASASARRQALLEQIGVPFRVRAADVDERALDGESPGAYVLRVAAAKATAVWRDLDGGSGQLVLAADTAVVLGGHLLGKPAHEEAAMAMLAALSGRTHRVLTGLAVRRGGTAETRLVESHVTLRATTVRERRAYCQTGEPFDKAGAYGIQGLGAVFVERIDGSYSAVVGLPLLETAVLLARFGLPRWLTVGEAAA
jgi:septum formation protein